MLLLYIPLSVLTRGVKVVENCKVPKYFSGCVLAAEFSISIS